MRHHDAAYLRVALRLILFTQRKRETDARSTGFVGSAGRVFAEPLLLPALDNFHGATVGREYRFT